MTAVGFATNDFSRSALGPDGTPAIGGAGHYRCVLPARALRSAGYRSDVGTLVQDSRTGEMGVGVHLPDGSREARWGYDVVVLQRWMREGIDQATRAARSTGQVILNDMDDWWEGLDPANSAWELTSPWTAPRKARRALAAAAGSAPEAAVENRDHYRRSLVASNLIVCSTPFLADRMRRLGEVRLIRNRVDAEAFVPAFRQRGLEAPLRPLTVGWVGVTAIRSRGDLESLRGVLGPFLDRHGAWLYHGGYRWGDVPLPEKVGSDPRRCVHRPVVTIDQYPALFAGFDIGLVPLVDKPFNHAKSCVKLMEYASAGLPAVAQASPENVWLSEEHGIGRVARRPRDWIRHLEALAAMGPEGRRAEGASNALKVSGLDVAGLAAEWKNLLIDLGQKAPERDWSDSPLLRR